MWLSVIGFVSVACGGQARTVEVTPYPTLDASQVELGREVYLPRCASCHGPNGQGAPGWATPGPEGYTLAPAHDDSGHTWHHPDRVLHEAIHQGMGDPLRPDSPLRMPAFGEALPEDEIRALISYFKSMWSEEHRLWQWNETLRDIGTTPTPP